MSETYKFSRSLWPTRGDRAWLAQQPLSVLQSCLALHQRLLATLQESLDTGAIAPPVMAVKEERELRTQLIADIEDQIQQRTNP